MLLCALVPMQWALKNYMSQSGGDGEPLLNSTYYSRLTEAAAVNSSVVRACFDGFPSFFDISDQLFD